MLEVSVDSPVKFTCTTVGNETTRMKCLTINDEVGYEKDTTSLDLWKIFGDADAVRCDVKVFNEMGFMHTESFVLKKSYQTTELLFEKHIGFIFNVPAYKPSDGVLSVTASLLGYGACIYIDSNNHLVIGVNGDKDYITNWGATAEFIVLELR